MDPSSSSRSSGLPKMSRLPHRPSSRATGSVDEGTRGAPASIPSTLPRAPKRSSIAIPRPTSAMRSYADPPTTQRNRQSMLVKPGFQKPIAREVQETDTNQMVSPTSPESPQSNVSSGSTLVAEENAMAAPRTTGRKPRPSLSDRTMESLSMVPPSPTPARRRQSGFFGADSPMKPPSRAGSALGSYSGPDSRAGSSIPAARPGSPSKGPSGSSSRIQSFGTPAAKRSVSSTSIGAGIASKRQSLQFPPSSSRIQSIPSPTAAGSKAGTLKPRTLSKPSSSGNRPTGGSKTVAARPPGTKSPVKDMFGGPLLNKPAAPTPTSPSRPTKPAIGKSSIGGLGAPRGLRKPGQAPKNKEEASEPPAEERKTANSSQSLRETIAAAKAARRATAETQPNAFMPRSIDESTISIGPDTDPNALDLVDSAHVNIIKKRINIARKDGKLNISALCLSEMPSEIMKMYEHDPNDAGRGAWYEDVDVTRLMAADNEFKELPSELFPPEPPVPTDGMSFGEEPPTGIFAGLSDIDLHGNALQALPMSMGNLPVLSTLNLSRNQLGNECLDVIGQIRGLKDLKLAENKLSGILPDSISQLEDLLTLDLQKNSITALPSSIGRMSKLSKLNVSVNRLSSIPFEAIFDLNVTEVIASRNQLNGYLIPSNVPSIQSLKTLDVSTNRLLGISEGDLDLPALHTLDMANNRVSELPNVTSWTNITQLNAEENKLSAFPEGFTSLQNLQNANFGNNSLLALDDDIGEMSSLISFNIMNNPIRERRLPRMATEELKATLRDRKTGSQSASVVNGNQSVAATTAGWPVKGGVLDRSNTRLQSIDQSDIEQLSGKNVTSLVLHHNQLPKVSPAIELLGESLISLDLSNNKLGKTDMYLTETMSLPNLQTLNLTSNALISLDPLVNRLTAPKLETLIFSFNRVKTLPRVCEAFPALTKLIASNNAISTLDVDAVRGLRVLDLSSNELEALPPKLAVLQGQLRTLMVTGNKFRVPGYAILQKGTEEVLKWLRLKIRAGEEGAIEEDADP